MKSGRWSANDLKSFVVMDFLLLENASTLRGKVVPLLWLFIPSNVFEKSVSESKVPLGFREPGGAFVRFTP